MTKLRLVRPPAPVPSGFHDVGDASRLLGIKRQTLTQWRRMKKGPPFLVEDSGRILYSRQDIIDHVCSTVTDAARQLKGPQGMTVELADQGFLVEFVFHGVVHQRVIVGVSERDAIICGAAAYIGLCRTDPRAKFTVVK